MAHTGLTRPLFRRGASILAALSLATIALAGSPGTAQAGTGTGGTPHLVPPAGTGKPAVSTASTLLGAAKAAAQAKAGGKPVVATALTTPTTQVTANPNGSLTMTETPVPTRVQQNGTWVNLDPTLTQKPDGSIGTTATTGALTLSKGGNGPLAVMNSDGQQLSMTLPVPLPAPTLSGATATYSNVISGVNLVVTATDSGGFSDVFVITTAAAATDPQLPSLLSATTTVSHGLSVTSDAAGNITVADQAGNAVFGAPVPTAWDSADSTSTTSAAGAPAAATPGPQSASPSTSGSTVDGPGTDAHVSDLSVTTASGAITLAAPTSLLTASTTEFPVYLDPYISPEFGNTGWGSVASHEGTTRRWNSTPDPTAGTAIIGDTDDGPGVGATRSLFDFAIPVSSLTDAHITSATFGITNNYSGACLTSGHDQYVDLYAPSSTYNTSNDYWNDWSGSLGTELGSESFADNWTDCKNNGAVAYTVTSMVTGDVSANKTTQTLALRADSETDTDGFKRFLANTAQLTITYDDYPNTPSGLYTTPTTTCGGDDPVGNGALALYAPVSDPSGDELTTTFDLYKTSDGTQANLLTPTYGVASDQDTTPSGQTAVMDLSLATLTSMSTVGGVASPTEFTWKADTSDGTLNSPGWSSSCNFTFNASRPAAPVIAPTQSPTTGFTCADVGDSNAGDAEQPVGTLCSFTFTAPGTTAVGSFVYQIDENAPITRSVGSSTSPYTTVVTVTLPRTVNTLNVYALSTSNNPGPDNSVVIDATPPPASSDGDLTGDGTPDLIVPGNTASSTNIVPPGLWLAQGNSNGSVVSSPINIGSSGLDFNLSPTNADPSSASDWNGAQAITGNFCGDGDQDVMAYFPGTSRADEAMILCGNETSAPLLGPTGQGGNPYLVPAGYLLDAGSDASIYPDDLANGYDVSNADPAGQQIPDLFATLDNDLYIFTTTSAGGYSQFNEDDLTATPSPDGTQDWNNWTITTTLLSSGVAMYLWNPSNGDLDLWTGLQLPTTEYPNATTLTPAHEYEIDTGWETPSLQLRAFNDGGVPALWATNTATGAITSYLPSSLTNDPVLTTTSTTLSPVQNHWPLNDSPVGTTPASTRDQITDSTTGTAPAGAVTETTDPYRQTAVANLPGSSSYLTLPNGLVDHSTTLSTTISFQTTVSASSGILVSTDTSAPSGLNAAAMPLMYIGTDGKLYAQYWTGSVNPIVSPGRVNDGQWHTATLAGAGTSQTLYLDGNIVGTVEGSISNVDPMNLVGAGVFNGNGWVNAPGTGGSVRASYFTGNVADVEYSPTIPPSALPSTPAHDWALNNGTSGTAATASDTGNFAQVPLAGSSAVTWNTGDTFSPDAKFSGTSSIMTSSSPALTFGANSMTISAWAKPGALGGVIASQSGTESAGMILYPDQATGDWYFCLSKTDNTTWNYDCVRGPAVSLNTWAQVTGTYNAATSTMTLYVNGTAAGTATHTAVSGFGGEFILGTYLYSGTLQGSYTGQLADVQTWNSVQIPVPAPSHQWKLNEGSGTVIHDSTGTLNGYISVTGADWTGTGGVSGLTLDGDSGFAFADGTALNTAATSSYTVSAWVNLSVLPTGNATAVSESGTNNSPFYLQYNSGAWAFALTNNDTSSPTFSGPSGPFTVAANTWYHITGVYNGSTNTAYIYVNGQLAGSATGVTSWSATGDLDIGSDLYAGSQVDFFPGTVNNVQTWNSALSSAQIATLG